MGKILGSYPTQTHQPPTLGTLRFRFCNITNCCKKCCKDFEKHGKCCKANVARILALFKMLQNSCCKNFENSCNIFFSNVATKKNLCPPTSFFLPEKCLKGGWGLA